ncbi:hypothetical protein ACQEVI_28115 [Promicromonospora sp. CA-289599]|uniref:hypothetical protein n=1 Tax=Promicromonospora sp. CA-289599 TaxID=3240014 RepID=UPI003D919C40
MSAQQERSGIPPALQRAKRMAMASMLTGVAAALVGAVVWHAGSKGQLLLVAGIMSGQTLAFLLWLFTGLSVIVLGLVGFRLFVIGYEAFTATMAALFLCAVILAAAVGVLITGLLSLLSAEVTYKTLHELDRPAGRQVVIEESVSLRGSTSWRFYVGGPFLYDEITAPTTTVECAELSNAGQTTFEYGEYLLRTGREGRDVITYAPEGHLSCHHGDVSRMVLPD